VTTERLALLQGAPALRGVPDEALAVLAEMARVDRFVEGDAICRRGEAAEEAYVVASGLVRVQVEEGVTVRELGPGEMIGEYGMLVGRVRTSTLIAVGPVTVLAFDYPRLLAFLRAYPDALLALFATAVERLVQSEARLRRDG
jgi:CRP-like cAMP-binding protein